MYPMAPFQGRNRRITRDKVVVRVDTAPPFDIDDKSGRMLKVQRIGQ